MRLFRFIVAIILVSGSMVAPTFAATRHHVAHGTVASQTVTTQVNINTADVAVLQTLSGIGAKKAEAIVAYREKNGKFASVDDLAKVKGIGAKFLERLQAKNSGRIVV